MTPFTRVVFLDAARDDLRSLAKRSRPMLVEVFRILKQLDAGTLVPQRLRNFGKTGDLSDCGKVVVVIQGEPEYRIVVRNLGSHFEVCEVIAVDERTGDLPYLLAALRLERLDDPIRRSDALRRIDRLRRERET